MRSVRSPRWGLLIAAVVVLVTLLPGAQPRPEPARAAGEDPYIKDTPLDSGVEPNPDTGPMWESQDIWVRATPDPNYSPLPFPESSPSWTPLAHESPEYRDPKYGVPNYVYVRVRNRGSGPTSGAERLRVYWSKASTGLAWPTQWVDYLGSTCGPTKLYGAEITKPRKNAATATPAERAAYIQAIVDIGTAAGLSFSDGLSYWHKQNQVHQLGPANRHGGPAFLPWHRELLNRYETLLQEANPTVKLLYWDWTTDPENSTGGFNFFTASFMGASGRGTGGVPIGAPFLPALAPPGVTRNLSTSTLPPAQADSVIVGSGLYQTFRSVLENSPNHNSIHGYVGGGGNLSFIPSAAQDPFFFLLHANVDRLWAKWQRDPAALSRLAPATAYDGASGNASITGAMAPWDGSGTPIVPWTIAGGYIVSKTPKSVSVVSPPIYDDAPLSIPVLQPGEAAVLQIPWYPPDPATFACFGPDQGHVCLLARIETSAAAPFGMTFPEGAAIGANTKNNNNIAWKNITVVDNLPGPLLASPNLIRNVFDKQVKASLRFANTEEIGASFFDQGQIIVDLEPKLFERWAAGGRIGKGVQVLDRTRLLIAAPDAAIENIALDPGETFSVEVQFVLNRDYKPTAGLRPKWRLIQLGSPDNPDEVVGGQTFEVEIGRLVLARPGGVWRYQDDHSTPDPSWIDPGFDDSRWRRGRAALGFGDSPDTTISPDPAGSKHRSTYFRRSFDLSDPSFYRSLLLRLRLDDGAAVYLNGVEIARVNLPAGALAPETPALRDVDGLAEQVWRPIDVSQHLKLLRQGQNVLAAEVHQSDPGGGDLTFDLELSANHARPAFAPAVGFAAPADGALFQIGQDIPVTVEALDDSALRKVALFADGQLLAESDRAPLSVVWRGAKQGSHRLRAVATDDNGEQSVLDRTVSVVENLAPAVRLVAPQHLHQLAAGGSIVISAEASDPGGAVQRVEFYLREGQRFDAPERLVGRDGTPPYVLALSGVAPGHYMLSALVFDDRGESSPSEMIDLEVEPGAGGTVFLPFVCRY